MHGYLYTRSSSKNNNNGVSNLLEKGMQNKNILGDLAIITGIVSFIPIMYKMWFTKNTSNFTWINLTLALISNLLWIMYGLSNNTVNKISGALYFCIYSYITVIKILY